MLVQSEDLARLNAVTGAISGLDILDVVDIGTGGFLKKM